MTLLALIVALLAPFAVTQGPYAGAYRVAPGGAINWYFSTTALLRMRTLPLAATRAYLDAYLAHLDPNEGIADAAPAPGGRDAPVAPDSEDAYAATALSLAVRYWHDSHDAAWWQRTSATWTDIAYAKLLTKFRADGLIRASGTDATGYLMDNVEDYAGLRDLASALAANHAAKARYVASFVGPLGVAIHRLYEAPLHAFRWSDSDPMGPLIPYPSCSAQLFPELYGVTSGNRLTDLRHFAGARKTVAGCRFSLDANVHEALLYALYIDAQHAPTPAERAFAEHVRRSPPASGDIVTATLLDALDIARGK